MTRQELNEYLSHYVIDRPKCPRKIKRLYDQHRLQGGKVCLGWEPWFGWFITNNGETQWMEKELLASYRE